MAYEYRREGSGAYSVRPSFKKAVTALGLIITVGMPVALGLGYMAELGNMRQAEEWSERLTESQKAVVQEAVDNDECGMVNSRVMGLCHYVKDGKLTL